MRNSGRMSEGWMSRGTALQAPSVRRTGKGDAEKMVLKDSGTRSCAVVMMGTVAGGLVWLAASGTIDSSVSPLVYGFAGLFGFFSLWMLCLGGSIEISTRGVCARRHFLWIMTKETYVPSSEIMSSRVSTLPQFAGGESSSSSEYWLLLKYGEGKEMPLAWQMDRDGLDRIAAFIQKMFGGKEQKSGKSTDSPEGPVASAQVME